MTLSHRTPGTAPSRARCADAPLYIDASDALTRNSAQALAHAARDLGITQIEDPVSSDGLAGLAQVRRHVAAPLEIIAGKYVVTLDDACARLATGGVHVRQAVHPMRA